MLAEHTSGCVCEGGAQLASLRGMGIKLKTGSYRIKSVP